MPESKVKCEFMDSCAFFNTLHFESTAKNLKMLYCEERWKECERWKIRVKGDAVPLNLWPNGEMA